MFTEYRNSIIAFGLGQLIYSTVYTLGYYIYFFHLIQSHSTTATTVTSSDNPDNPDKPNQETSSVENELWDYLKKYKIRGLFPHRQIKIKNSENSENLENLENNQIGTNFFMMKNWGISTELFHLTRAFTFQSFQKIILTEGEKMVLVGTGSDLADQGI